MLGRSLQFIGLLGVVLAQSNFLSASDAPRNPDETRTLVFTRPVIFQPPGSRLERAPDVIFVPTPQNVVDEMLRLARVKPGDIVMDLGCGDGRIPIAAAKLKAWGFGYDVDARLIKESQKNAKAAKVEDRVLFEARDAFKLDLSQADVVTLYLLPSLNVKLIPQLKRMKPGARVVSHSFDIEGVKPDKVVTVKGDFERTIYLYTIPLQK